MPNKLTEGLKKSTKLDSWLVLGYEKLAREYGLSIEEVRTATVTIKDGEITIKAKGKK